MQPLWRRTSWYCIKFGLLYRARSAALGLRSLSETSTLLAADGSSTCVGVATDGCCHVSGVGAAKHVPAIETVSAPLHHSSPNSSRQPWTACFVALSRSWSMGAAAAIAAQPPSRHIHARHHEAGEEKAQELLEGYFRPPNCLGAPAGSLRGTQCERAPAARAMPGSQCTHLKQSLQNPTLVLNQGVAIQPASAAAATAARGQACAIAADLDSGQRS